MRLLHVQTSQQQGSNALSPKRPPSPSCAGLAPSGGFESPVRANSGEYLMKLSITLKDIQKLGADLNNVLNMNDNGTNDNICQNMYFVRQVLQLLRSCCRTYFRQLLSLGNQFRFKKLYSVVATRNEVHSMTSKLKFIPDAVVWWPQAVSTPITKKEPEPLLPHLESISVVPTGYQIKTDDSDSRHTTNITFHFTDADVLLKSKNTFIEVEAGLVCLAMVPSTGVAIFGNLSQMDYLVGYDLVAGKVSFEPTDCTKQ
ncbi:hypothetical protein Leryth_000522 [Lithospermum erythrorhizon]|nr:hypothetical protein Leryth_000522 [Lithospermum erythrorhizon]